MVRVLRDPNKKGTGAPRGQATQVSARVSVAGGRVSQDQVSRFSIRRLIARNPAKGTSANIGTQADHVVPAGFVATVPASLTTAMAGANNDVVFRSAKGGVSGNSIRVAVVVAGANTPLSVAVSGNDVTINSATSAGSTATTTAAQMIAAVKASAQASALVNVELAAGNDGTGVIAAFSLTNLTGGTDSKLEGTNSVGDSSPEILNGAFKRGATETHKNVVNRSPNRRIIKR